MARRTKRKKRTKPKSPSPWIWPFLALLGLFVVMALTLLPRRPPELPSPEMVRALVEATCFELGLKRQRVEVSERRIKVILPRRMRQERFLSTLKARLSAFSGLEIRQRREREGLGLEIQTSGGTLRVLLSYPKREPPQVAVVVDDLGPSLSQARSFMDLGEPLTLSLLPFEAESRRIALEAHRRGFEILVHVPMEPKAYPLRNPGRGALLVSMSKGELQEAIEQALDAIPFAIGANNHMGSRFMEDGHKVALLMEALSRRGMIFLDSLTTPHSQGKREATRRGLRFYKRDVFLDNDGTVGGFLNQWGKLLHLASRKGWAIGICHPHPSSLKGLSMALVDFRGAELVPLTWLPPEGFQH